MSENQMMVNNNSVKSFKIKTTYCFKLPTLVYNFWNVFYTSEVPIAAFYIVSK